MTRLSSRWTVLYRYSPVFYAITGAIVAVAQPDARSVIVAFVVAASVFMIWYGARLSDVWLDGDVLDVKGRTPLRISLSHVSRVETAWMGRSRMLVLGLDEAVGGVQKIRFIPDNARIEGELQARIHAARAARKA